MPMPMECLLLIKYGDPPQLAADHLPVPVPEAGEVLIQVHASPLNPSDWIFLHGKNPNRRALPTIPGFEGAGVVVGVGAGATDSLLGCRVAFRSKPTKHG